MLDKHDITIDNTVVKVVSKESSVDLVTIVT